MHEKFSGFMGSSAKMNTHLGLVSRNQRQSTLDCRYLTLLVAVPNVPIHEIARQPGEARARLPVRASPGCLAILCIGTVYLRNCYQ
jgi:hypothetical protein